MEPNVDIDSVARMDQISTRWLETALAGAGLDSARLASFSTKKVGTGQAAVCCRIALDYDGPGAGLPASIVAKFPAEDESSRESGRKNKTYVREVNFYRHLKPLFSIPTPDCYLARIEGDGPDFALLLEDLAPAEQGDQIAGCTPEIARAAVLNLVGMHAPSWHNSAILGLEWLGNSAQPDRSRTIMAMYRRALPHFLERCSEGLEAAELDLIRRIAELEDYPSEYPILQGHCLVHNDYRSDNMLIDESKTPTSMHVVDWQTIGMGNPMKDVAYFLGGCLLPQRRAAIELDVLREYHQQLVAAGVTDYDWEQCFADYRRASFHGIMTAAAAMLHVTKTERGDRLFAIMAQRHARQALDNGADEFLN